MERLGGQLRVHQPAGRQPGEAARRLEDDLPGGRVRAQRSAAAWQRRGDRRGRLSRRADSAARQSGALRRQPERRNLLLQRRQGPEWRSGSDPARDADGQGDGKDAARRHPRPRERDRCTSTLARGPALRHGPGQSGVSAEQAGWHRSPAHVLKPFWPAPCSSPRRLTRLRRGRVQRRRRNCAPRSGAFSKKAIRPERRLSSFAAMRSRGSQVWVWRTSRIGALPRPRHCSASARSPSSSSRSRFSTWPIADIFRWTIPSTRWCRTFRSRTAGNARTRFASSTFWNIRRGGTTSTFVSTRRTAHGCRFARRSSMDRPRAHAVIVWRMPSYSGRGGRRFSIAVAPALLIASGYLGYWGILGLRTWAY